MLDKHLRRGEITLAIWSKANRLKMIMFRNNDDDHEDYYDNRWITNLKEFPYLFWLMFNNVDDQSLSFCFLFRLKENIFAWMDWIRTFQGARRIGWWSWSNERQCFITKTGWWRCLSSIVHNKMKPNKTQTITKHSHAL